ncbi:hypothetical protein GGX14DRAFT_417610 [Mycena pura]|uniref:Uncharacterized protein n=1 Tax=Mycena pura TaxID=153505 RepID=A0AAD6YR37_9AGAR|nr:hypothetical protein GGX14DRAFT_417610 [Mycena pura]
MNALIYHDELLPISTALSKCTSYLRWRCLNYLMSFVQYWDHLTGEWLDVLNYAEHTDWFRTSTGQLCIELGTNCGSYLYAWDLIREGHANAVDIPTAWNSMSNAELVNMVNIKDLLKIVSYTQWEWKAVSLHHGHIHLGALYSLDDRTNPYVPMLELLYLPVTIDSELSVGVWRYLDGEGISYGSEHMISTGWSRIDLHKLHDSELCKHREFQVQHFRRLVTFVNHMDIELCWLAQANNFIPKDSSLATAVCFNVTIWYSTNDIGLRGTFMADAPMGDLYLFLFNPHVGIQDGVVSVEIPSTEDAYYWSFQHDGQEPLSAEILDEINPPQVLLEVHVGGEYWSEKDYQLIQEIIRAKGLDPTDLAAHLGYPLAVMHNIPLLVPLYGAWIGVPTILYQMALIMYSATANTSIPELNTFQVCSPLCWPCGRALQLAAHWQASCAH